MTREEFEQLAALQMRVEQIIEANGVTGSVDYERIPLTDDKIRKVADVLERVENALEMVRVNKVMLLEDPAEASVVARKLQTLFRDASQTFYQFAVDVASMLAGVFYDDHEYNNQPAEPVDRPTTDAREDALYLSFADDLSDIFPDSPRVLVISDIELDVKEDIIEEGILDEFQTLRYAKHTLSTLDYEMDYDELSHEYIFGTVQVQMMSGFAGLSIEFGELADYMALLG